MDLGILIPSPEQTLKDRFTALKNVGIKFEAYEGNVSKESVSQTVDKIAKNFLQNFPIYIPQGLGCFFNGGGIERIIALMQKTEQCELYHRGVESAENLGIPVLETIEDAQKYFGKTVEDFACFSAELHIIDGRPVGFNGGLDSDAHYFVLPSRRYVKQDLIQTITVSHSR